MNLHELARYPEPIVEEVQDAIARSRRGEGDYHADVFLFAIYPRLDDGTQVLGVITPSESCGLTRAMIRTVGTVEIAGEPFVLRVPRVFDEEALEGVPLPAINILQIAGPLDEANEQSKRLLMPSDVTPAMICSVPYHLRPAGWPR
jgi:hypothetical protein